MWFGAPVAGEPVLSGNTAALANHDPLIGVHAGTGVETPADGRMARLSASSSAKINSPWS